MPRPKPKRKSPTTKADVLDQCKAEFKKLTGRDWDPEWRRQIRMAQRHQYAADKAAKPFADAIVVAILAARKFLDNSDTARRGLCAKALASWIAKLDDEGSLEDWGPLQFATPQELRPFLLWQFNRAVHRHGDHVLPRDLLEPFVNDNADTPLCLPTKVAAGSKAQASPLPAGPTPILSIESVNQHVALSDGEILQNSRVLTPRGTMPTLRYFAVLSILCGSYPDVDGHSLETLTPKDIIGLEHRAMRAAAKKLIIPMASPVVHGVGPVLLGELGPNVIQIRTGLDAPGAIQRFGKHRLRPPNDASLDTAAPHATEPAPPDLKDSANGGPTRQS